MALGITDTATVAITVSGIDILALKKLAIVSHALAGQLSGNAANEQRKLVGVLDELIRKIESQAVNR